MHSTLQYHIPASRELSAQALLCADTAIALRPLLACQPALASRGRDDSPPVPDSPTRGLSGRLASVRPQSEGGHRPGKRGCPSRLPKNHRSGVQSCLLVREGCGRGVAGQQRACIRCMDGRRVGDALTRAASGLLGMGEGSRGARLCRASQAQTAQGCYWRSGGWRRRLATQIGVPCAGSCLSTYWAAVLRTRRWSPLPSHPTATKFSSPAQAVLRAPSSGRWPLQPPHLRRRPSPSPTTPCSRTRATHRQVRLQGGGSVLWARAAAAGPAIHTGRWPMPSSAAKRRRCTRGP